MDCLYDQFQVQQISENSKSKRKTWNYTEFRNFWTYDYKAYHLETLYF